MRELYRDLVDKNVITFTTDKNYLPFAKILVNSIEKNSPNLEIVVLSQILKNYLLSVT